MNNFQDALAFLAEYVDEQRARDMLQYSGHSMITLPSTHNVVVQHKGDGIEDGHEVLYQTEAPKHQYRCFLETWRTTGAPVVLPDGPADAPCQ